MMLGALVLLLVLVDPTEANPKIVKVTEGQTVCLDTKVSVSGDASPVSWTRRGTWNDGERYIFRCPFLAEHFKCNVWTDWVKDYEFPKSELFENGTLCMTSVTRSDSGEYFPTYGASKIMSTPHAISILPEKSFRLIVMRNIVPFDITDNIDDSKMRLGRFAPRMHRRMS
ncbi:hypothetical protein L596_015138 [Steinernema carpocapsae]|uniref:Ig-like domain-containing protein n=1 Tax=Steinernema carpocapsae TaxID=34508 RepID=A0A4U5NFD3_STECR|nr:hypothetical protein L596_015138 [Steinernema carpocapsae]